MKSSTKQDINNLHLSDIYSLMLFVLFKVQEIPEYAVTSELCYLLDGANMTRLLTYFAGRTVKFPTESDLAVVYPLRKDGVFFFCPDTGANRDAAGNSAAQGSVTNHGEIFFGKSSLPCKNSPPSGVISA